MPIIKFMNKNKYGNFRTRIFYSPNSQYTIKPKGLGPVVGVSIFKYTYEDPITPPSLFVGLNGDKYIIPGWIKVLPETTLDDIEWVKPIEEVKTIKNSWTFKSSSQDKNYTVHQNGNLFTCNCMGYFRSKDRECKHIKEIKSKIQ